MSCTSIVVSALVISAMLHVINLYFDAYDFHLYTFYNFMKITLLHFYSSDVLQKKNQG